MMARHGIFAFAIPSLMAMLPGCMTSTGTIPVVPDKLKPPATQTLTLETRARGVQIYECRASKDNPARFEWVFVAPEAELFDSTGKKIGTHYAAPTGEPEAGR